MRELLHDLIILVVVKHVRSKFAAPEAIDQCFCGDGIESFTLHPVTPFAIHLHPFALYL